MNNHSSTDLERMTEINLTDILFALGGQDSELAKWLVRIVFRTPAEKFSRDVLEYDKGVQEGGLAEGGRRILSRLVREVSVEGAQTIPQIGPVMILSNHPGLTDTVALFASIPRQDVCVLASARPFLEMLRGTSQHMIYIPEGLEGRLEALRRAAGHLRGGGTLLTFPAGKIEPDPAALPGAVEALDHWNPSTGLFVRMVPQMAIVPAIVSGVLARESLRHPLTHLRSNHLDREWLGASLQLVYKELWPEKWPVTVRVRFAPPMQAAEFADLREPESITRAITDRIRPFLEAIVRSDFPPSDQASRIS